MSPLEPGMNRTLTEIPALADDYYVHRTPKWLMMFIRLALGVGGVVLAVLSYRDWSHMPLGFRGLVCILVPAFLLFALRSTRTTKFVADTRGVFFPCNELLVTTIGRKNPNTWLFVPWGNIMNIRVGTSIDYEGDKSKCVAFDVKVSSQEKAAFFQHVGAPTDREQSVNGFLSVAYSDNPPAPRKAVAILLQLRQLRHNTSS
jgi:hypothetical protein